jgi:hypothetical protein
MVDLVLVPFIAAFLRGGWSSGFVRRLAGLIFLVVSFVAGAFLFVAGAYLRAPAGALVHTLLPKIPEQYADMVGYLVAFSALLIGFNLFSSVILSKVAKTGPRTDQLLGVLLVLGPLLPKDISSIVPTTIPGGLPGFPIPHLP